MTYADLRHRRLLARSTRSELWEVSCAGTSYVLKSSRCGSGAGAIADESRALQRLAPHPHIVSWVADIDAGSFLMEYVDGLDLATAIDSARRSQTPPGPPIPSHVGRAIASALAHAHSQGVLHRDICPENVLLGLDGSVKLADFEIAQHSGREASTTQGFIQGRLAYLAPELADGTETVATDVFALGVLLICIATGRPNPEQHEVEGWVHPRLRCLAATMTHRDPGSRPSAQEVVEALWDGSAPTGAALGEWLGRLSGGDGALDHLVFGP